MMKYINSIFILCTLLTACNEDVGPCWAPDASTSNGVGGSVIPVGQGGFGNSEESDKDLTCHPPSNINDTGLATWVVTYAIECKEPSTGKTCICAEDDEEVDASSCSEAQRIVFDECECTDYTNYQCAFTFWDCFQK